MPLTGDASQVCNCTMAKLGRWDMASGIESRASWQNIPKETHWRTSLPARQGVSPRTLKYKRGISRSKPTTNIAEPVLEDYGQVAHVLPVRLGLRRKPCCQAWQLLTRQGCCGPQQQQAGLTGIHTTMRA